MSKHTPGPWFYEEGMTRDRLHPFVKAADGRVICSCRTDNKHANARLIAAAPDLLETLEAIVDFEAGPDFSRWARIVQRAESAIAKARGKQ